MRCHFFNKLLTTLTHEVWVVYLGLIRPDLWLQQPKLHCKVLKQCHMYQHVELKASKVKNMGHLTEETN